MQSESYHTLLFNHLPVPLSPTIKESLSNVQDLFQEIDRMYEEAKIEKKPLNIDSSFNIENLLSYVLYRLWYAHKKFPSLTDDIAELVIKNFPLMGLSMKFGVDPGINNPIGLSTLLHASRGLVEGKIEIAERALGNCASSFLIKEARILEESSAKIYDELELIKEKITKTSLFKNAIIEYFNVLQASKSQEEVQRIVENCQNAKIRAVSHVYAPDIGLVTPDGFGICIEKIVRAFPNPNECLARFAAIICHELGHLAIRVKEFSEMEFANNTPNQTYITNGVTYENLEGGYLFSLILLGIYQKSIWTVEELRNKLLNPESWPEKVPLFSQEELQNVQNDEPITNAYQSGVVSISNQKHLFL